MDLVPFQSVKKLRDIVDIMDEAARRIVAERKEALCSGEDAVLQQIGEGKDILSRLRKRERNLCLSLVDEFGSPRQYGDSRERASRRGDCRTGLVRRDVQAYLPQCAHCACNRTLVFAATDTTSSAVSRILNLLGQHKDVQEKLCKEIVEARQERGDLSFDDLFELPYLEAVCRETLRLYVRSF